MQKTDAGFLYEKYAVMVKAVSIKGTQCHEAAEDIRQQVFVNVFKSLKDFRNECQMKTWIYQITLNECYHYRLRKWRETRKVTAFLENKPLSRHEVEHWEDKILVARLLELADVETRKAMHLIYAEDMTQEQIAKTLGVSRVTIHKRMEKFRKKALASMQGQV